MPLEVDWESWGKCCPGSLSRIDRQGLLGGCGRKPWSPERQRKRELGFRGVLGFREVQGLGFIGFREVWGLGFRKFRV